MEFALNYSPQAVDMLAAGKIELDRLKCPDWPDLVAEALAVMPAYVHFDLVAGRGTLADTDWDKIERLLVQTGTPYVNVHLAPQVDDFPELAHEPIDNAAWAEAAEATMLRDVELLVQRFGASRVIAENVPYYGAEGDTNGSHFVRACVEPAVIRRVIESTGVGFLLDVSHGRISARTLGMDEHGYIESLPVERLRELHVTGMQYLSGKLTDHLDLTDADWPYVEWAVGKIAAGAWSQPWVAAFEYGGVSPKFDWRSRADVIAAQVPRLVDLVRAVPV